MTASTALPLEAQDVDGMLASMAAAGQGEREGRLPVGAKPPKMRYSHIAMAETLVANPWMSQNELAAMFGKSPSWISTIVCSDAFQSLLEQKRAELVDPELRLTIKERLQALTVKSLQVLQQKLHDNPSDGLALRALELGSKGLGVGQQQETILVTSEERLAGLAQRLKALSGGTGSLQSPRTPPAAEVFDVESREVRHD